MRYYFHLHPLGAQRARTVQLLHLPASFGGHLAPLLQTCHVATGNCQHGPGQGIDATTPQGAKAKDCEDMAGTNWASGVGRHGFSQRLAALRFCPCCCTWNKEALRPIALQWQKALGLEGLPAGGGRVVCNADANLRRSLQNHARSLRT